MSADPTDRADRAGADRVDRQPRPGRPRSAETDRAILAATRRLLAEQGYAALSIEAVARAAEVGRPTVYRRHPTKAALVAAALADSLAAVNPTAPDSGDVRADLHRVLTNLARALTTTEFGPAVAEIVSPARRDPGLAELCRTAVDERRELIRSVVRRADRDGRLLSTDVETTIDLALGGIYFRHLISGAPLSGRFVSDLVDSLIGPDQAEPKGTG